MYQLPRTAFDEPFNSLLCFVTAISMFAGVQLLVDTAWYTDSLLSIVPRAVTGRQVTLAFGALAECYVLELQQVIDPNQLHASRSYLPELVPLPHPLPFLHNFHTANAPLNRSQTWKRISSPAQQKPQGGVIRTRL